MIIGLVGLPCSGSDAVGKMLVERGFTWLSYSDLLREELTARGSEITRESMQNLGNELRKLEGAGALSNRLLARTQPGKDYVFGTIRNPAEIIELKKHTDAFVLHVAATPEIRFARMKVRNRENDPQTYAAFEALDEKELGKGQTTDGLRMGDCFALADGKIVNDGTLKELQANVDSFLAQCRKQ